MLWFCTKFAYFQLKSCLQGQLRSAQASLQEWRNAFQSIAANAGLALEPTALLAHLQQTHQQPATTTSSGNTPTEDTSILRQRESQLQAQLMEKILENMELRRHLQAAKAAAEPNVVQAYLFATPMLCIFTVKNDLHPLSCICHLFAYAVVCR